MLPHPRSPGMRGAALGSHGHHGMEVGRAGPLEATALWRIHRVLATNTNKTPTVEVITAPGKSGARLRRGSQAPRSTVAFLTALPASSIGKAVGGMVRRVHQMAQAESESRARSFPLLAGRTTSGQIATGAERDGRAQRARARRGRGGYHTLETSALSSGYNSRRWCSRARATKKSTEHRSR